MKSAQDTPAENVNRGYFHIAARLFDKLHGEVWEAFKAAQTEENRDFTFQEQKGKQLQCREVFSFHQTAAVRDPAGLRCSAESCCWYHCQDQPRFTGEIQNPPTWTWLMRKHNSSQSLLSDHSYSWSVSVCSDTPGGPASMSCRFLHLSEPAHLYHQYC